MPEFMLWRWSVRRLIFAERKQKLWLKDSLGAKVQIILFCHFL
jgi:hypothetical protein